MPRRRGKTISFDAMVKFFMQNYHIPTKKDVERLMAKLDRLENLIQTTAGSSYASRAGAGRRRSTQTAIDTVFDVIKRSKKGLNFAEIQAKTGFAEKKIRNIIFRLHKIEKIKRKSRGIYIAD